MLTPEQIKHAIESKKPVKLRRGYKAYLLHILDKVDEDNDILVGYIEDERGMQYPEGWKGDGYYFTSKQAFDNDIVSFWPEERYALMRGKEMIEYVYDSLEQAKMAAAVPIEHWMQEAVIVKLVEVE